MLNVKNLSFTIIGLLCVIGFWALSSLAERFQGLSGYVYEYGMYADIFRIILLVVGFILIIIAVVDINWEIPD